MDIECRLVPARWDTRGDNSAVSATALGCGRDRGGKHLVLVLSEARAVLSSAKTPLPHEEVEVGQDFKLRDGLLPCAAAVRARVGGIQPFLGLKPAWWNLKGALRNDTATCQPVMGSADRLMRSLERSRGDEAFCLIRGLMQPSSQLRRTLEGFLGRAVREASSRTPLNAPDGAAAGAAAATAAGAQRSAALPPGLPPLAPRTAALGVLPAPGLTPVVGLHLRLQEAISTEHDVNWALQCTGAVARQLAAGGNGGRPSPVVLFVLATDTPTQLPQIEEHYGGPPCAERSGAAGSRVTMAWARWGTSATGSRWARSRCRSARGRTGSSSPRPRAACTAAAASPAWRARRATTAGPPAGASSKRAAAARWGLTVPGAGVLGSYAGSKGAGRWEVDEGGTQV